MSEWSACSASDREHHFCRNGFPQRASCFGTNGTPVCCQEEVCARLFEKWGGKPPDFLRSPTPSPERE